MERVEHYAHWTGKQREYRYVFAFHCRPRPGSGEPEYSANISAQVFPGGRDYSIHLGRIRRYGAECDKIVLSPDPGAVCCDEITGIHNNVNRQLVSTKAGLKIAGKPYILKTRTDIIFRDAGFLTFWRKYDALPSRFFQNRILICNYFTRSPRAISLCFHPSDWLVFGGAEDVRSYYMQTPLMTQTEGGWFSSHPKTSTFLRTICAVIHLNNIFLSIISAAMSMCFVNAIMRGIAK